MSHYPAQQILILILGVGVLLAAATLCLKVDEERNACLVLAVAVLLCFVSLGATVEGEYHLIASLMEGQPETDASDPGKPVWVGSLKPIDGRYYPPLRPTNAMFSQPREGGAK